MNVLPWRNSKLVSWLLLKNLEPVRKGPGNFFQAALLELDLQDAVRGAPHRFDRPDTEGWVTDTLTWSKAPRGG